MTEIIKYCILNVTLETLFVIIICAIKKGLAILTGNTNSQLMCYNSIQYIFLFSDK